MQDLSKLLSNIKKASPETAQRWEARAAAMGLPLTEWVRDVIGTQADIHEEQILQALKNAYLTVKQAREQAIVSMMGNEGKTREEAEEVIELIDRASPGMLWKEHLPPGYLNA